jgi:hypothetical protein
LAAVLCKLRPLLAHCERRVQVIQLGSDRVPGALLAGLPSPTLPFALPRTAAVGGASRALAMQKRQRPTRRHCLMSPRARAACPRPGKGVPPAALVNAPVGSHGGTLSTGALLMELPV